MLAYGTVIDFDNDCVDQYKYVDLFFVLFACYFIGGHWSFLSYQQIRHQILKLNGLDADQLEPDEVKDMVEVLIQESIDQYGFEPKQDIHKKFDKLSKFYYMKSKEASEDVNENKESLDRSGDLKSKDAKALESGESGDGNVTVKIENPEYLSMKNKLKVVVSAKSRFAGVLDKCKDTLLLFDSKKENSPEEYKNDGCLAVHTQFEGKVTEALEILEALRILDLLVCLFILKNICSC